MAIRKKTLKKLSRSRLSIRAKKLRPRKVKPFQDVQLRQGLNMPESIIAAALDDLNIPYRMQVKFGGGSALGGARVDFLITGRDTVIEYAGPFHRTLDGEGRDLLRNLTLGSLRIITLTDKDLPTIKPTLLRELGSPVSTGTIQISR